MYSLLIYFIHSITTNPCLKAIILIQLGKLTPREFKQFAKGFIANYVAPWIIIYFGHYSIFYKNCANFDQSRALRQFFRPFDMTCFYSLNMYFSTCWHGVWILQTYRVVSLLWTWAHPFLQRA